MRARGRRAVSAKLSCRDLWAEILGRICYWRNNGGDWCTSWVRGHVDSTDTEQEKWTRAEWGNVAADAMASSQLSVGGGGDWLRPKYRCMQAWSTKMMGLKTGVRSRSRS